MSSNNCWRLPSIAVIALVMAWLGRQWENIDHMVRALVLGLSIVGLGLTLMRSDRDGAVAYRFRCESFFLDHVDVSRIE